jgi:hypothetical protein
MAASSEAPVQAQVATQPQQTEGDVYIDEAADYMMLDNHEIYAYLAESY